MPRNDPKVCPICGRRFPTVPLRISHQANAHTDDEEDYRNN